MGRDRAIFTNDPSARRWHYEMHATVRGTDPRKLGGTASLVGLPPRMVTPPTPAAKAAATTAADPTDVAPIVANGDIDSDCEIRIVVRPITPGAVRGRGCGHGGGFWFVLLGRIWSTMVGCDVWV